MTEPNLEQLIVEAATNFNMPEPESTLLLEFTSNPGDQFTATTTSSSSDTDDEQDALYIEGVFISAKANTDIKFSSTEDMHRAVREYQKQFVVTGQALGELRSVDWKPAPTPNPASAALRVVDLQITSNGDVRGTAVLISPKLRALVLAGWKPVIRVRALGRRSGGVLQPGIKIMAFDAAWSSDQRSTLNAFGRTGGGDLSINEQVETPPTPATPSTGKAKPRLITVESLSEAVANRQSQSQRMKQWIDSCRNNTKF